MQSAFYKPTDLTAPGAIEDLLAFHKARFGDARMEDEGGGGGDGGAGGDAGGDKGGKSGGSTSTTGFPANTPLEEMTGEQREAYWKHQARKHETRAKAFDGLTPEDVAALKEKADKHDALEQELMSDKDKAIAAARAEEQSKATPRIVRAEFKAAAKGVLTDDQLAALLEDRDLTKYVNTKGDPDEDKISKLVTAFAPSKGRTGPSATGLGHRTGGTGAPGDQGRAQAERRFGKKS